MGQVDRLPSHFPTGTRYVAEGRDGRIHSRYLEFPDGRHVDLPANVAPPKRRVKKPTRNSRK
jgi:hypothetical protein